MQLKSFNNNNEKEMKNQFDNLNKEKNKLHKQLNSSKIDMKN
jgi:hypothetical protein